jgi:hypothetical protein
VIAAALFNWPKVAEILDLDLSYTPPLGSPWDPWQAAARNWCDKRAAEQSLRARESVRG